MNCSKPLKKAGFRGGNFGTGLTEIFAIKGTGPIVQKMIEEKWRSWDEAKKRREW
jgi:hypothetical protein